MKKIFIYLALILLAASILPVFAEDNSTGGIEDTLKYSNFLETGFEGQKKITDEEFQKTLEQLKAKKNKKKNKQIKGTGFNEENNKDYIDETMSKNVLLRLPLELINGDGTEIPIGHYKIVGEKTREGVYLDFYQSSELIARVPAIETTNDFSENGINFVKLLPYNEERVRIIYGSLDFNAYTFIRIKNKISDSN